MLTRIISGAVGVVLLGAVLFFHDTVVLPIAVAAIIAVMLFELIRAVKLHKCLPILIAAASAGVSVPVIYYMSKVGSVICDITESGLQGDRVNEMAAEINRLFQFAIILLAAFVIFFTWLRKHKEIRYEQVFFVLAVMILVPQQYNPNLFQFETGSDLLFYSMLFLLLVTT